MHVVHVVGSLDSSTGGPAYSVPSLVQALNKEGVSAEIVCRDIGDYRGSATSTIVRPGQLQRLVTERIRNNPAPLVIHDHGVWSQLNREAANAARQLSLGRVLSPRGMLEPWSLRHKRLKKLLAWWMYQSRDFRAASLVHVTSEQELASIRLLSKSIGVVLAPNGVDIPTPYSFPTSSARRLLFLSRVHPKKGLYNLIDAWSITRPKSWILDIVGPGSSDYLSEIRRHIEFRNVGDSVTLLPPVTGEEKRVTFGKADALVLPSHSENFGMVVAEALAAGRPVIATKATSWADLDSRGCGWSIDVGVEPLVPALRDLESKSRVDLAAMGENGRKWMTESYGWSAIARTIICAYERLRLI